MTQSVYAEKLGEMLLILIIDLVLPNLWIIPKLCKKEQLKMDGDLIGLIVTVFIANGLLSYILGYGAFFDINIVEQAMFSYQFMWVVVFLVLCIIEYLVYFFWSKREIKVSMDVSMSPNDYKELILKAEKGAKTIWLMPKRLHVMLKSEAFIHYLAVKRFGMGSEYICAYENEHLSRKSALYQGLNNGMKIRELHNKDDLIAYIKGKTHIGVENIEKQYFSEMLVEWKRILAEYPMSYNVRLTQESIPLKYELIDNKKMVIHESVGNNSKDRLNAIFVENPIIVKKISNDFLQVWERVPSEERENEYVINFIDTVLLPLLD